MKKIKSYSIAFCVLLIAMSTVIAQDNSIIKLWPNGAPGAVSNGGEEKVRINEPTGDHVVSNIHNPSITTYIPSKEKSTGIAMVIAPGGGHRELWIDHEGYNVAELLVEKGIAAFVLKYRLANEEGSSYTVDDHSVKDMQRAIRLVRSRASEWGINPSKIGVMGFSAGGEVAGLTDMNSDDGLQNSKDQIDKLSSKSNFHALIYPGRSERIVPNAKSSPVFILCGGNDGIANRLGELYLKFRNSNVPVDLHIYSNVGHGFGIRKNNTGSVTKWVDRMVDWINEIDFGSN